MARYRKKPIEIEAWHFSLVNPETRPAWLGAAIANGDVYMQGGDAPYFTVRTLEGDMRASLGDYIIRGVEGELYPCKASIFEATYERVT